MRIALAGPLETNAVLSATGRKFDAVLPKGSVQTPLSLIAAGLLELGHEVHLITTDAMLDVVESYSSGPLTITYCPLRGAPRYRARERSRDLFAKEIAFLTEAMKASGADIVHAHWTYEFAEAAVRSRLPHLVTMRDLGWEYLFKLRDGYRLMRLLMKYRVMPRVKNLSSIAPFMLGKGWQYGYFGKIDLVPNPVGYSDWKPKPSAPPIIAAVGNGGAIKNIAKAVDAFAIIRAAHPQAQLHLFGPGLEADSALARAVPGVVGHGHLEHAALMDFLRDEATILIHPSLIETFGVIVAEAKMRGVPVLAGKNSGGVGFVVGEDAGGVLCDVTDAKAIAASALALLDNPDFATLQQKAHEDMTTRFSVNSIAVQYEAIYRRIVSEQR